MEQGVKICRLCLKILTENDFEIVDTIKLGMLEVLLLKLNIGNTDEPLICNACVSNLKKLFYFKSTCLTVEECINRFNQCNFAPKVDLMEVYWAESKNEKEKCDEIYLNQRVCRFCLNFFEGNTMNEIREDMCLMGVLTKYFPELDLDVTKEISACEHCLDCLIRHFNFATTCLDTERSIIEYCQMEKKDCNGKVDLKSILEFSADTNNGDPIKVEEDVMMPDNVVMDQVMAFDTFGGCIKSEDEVDIKTEYSDTASFSTAEEAASLSPPKSDNTPHQNHQTNVPKEKASLQCTFCTFEAKTRSGYNRHSLSHKDVSEVEMYKCELCPFQTKYKGTRHLLTHKDPSEVTMYSCDKCTFQSKHKGSYTRHMLTHNQSLPITLYRCDKCVFVCSHKCSLILHMNTHRPEAEPLHHCKECTYKAKLKGNLKKHMLTHKSPSETVMYLCEKCAFKTKHKISLETHMQMHRKKSEVASFKCDVCEFSAKYKGNLKKHMLVHKTSSEVTMYKCDQCLFQTKHKISLKTHMVQHKNASEVTLYKCDLCAFTAKHKGNLKLHSLIHKDPYETIMYKCDKCSFETKHKVSLKTHMLKHMKLCDVAMNKCEICGFETLHKGNLKKHLLTHKDPSEVTMYHCNWCFFETKHKESLKTHIAWHQS